MHGRSDPGPRDRLGQGRICTQYADQHQHRETRKRASLNTDHDYLPLAYCKWSPRLETTENVRKNIGCGMPEISPFSVTVNDQLIVNHV